MDNLEPRCSTCGGPLGNSYSFSYGVKGVPRVYACEDCKKKPNISFDSQSWPHPDSTIEIEWRLRYGEPTKSDLLASASVLIAYRQLFTQPTALTLNVIQAIKDCIRNETKTDNV